MRFISKRGVSFVSVVSLGIFSCLGVNAQDRLPSHATVSALVEGVERALNADPIALDVLSSYVLARAAQTTVEEKAPVISVPSERGCDDDSVSFGDQLFKISIQTDGGLPSANDQTEPLLSMPLGCITHSYEVSPPLDEPRLPSEVAEIIAEALDPTVPATPTPTPIPTLWVPSTSLYLTNLQRRVDCFPIQREKKFFEEIGWYDFSYEQDSQARRTTVSVAAGGRWVNLGGAGDWRFGDIFNGRFEKDAETQRTDMNMSLGLGFSGRIGGFTVGFSCILVSDNEIPGNIF